MNSKTKQVLHVGAVPFLNGRPLVRYLETDGIPPVELKFEVPSQLTHMMDEGLLDIAHLPSIEYFRKDKYKIIPEICISADGPVKSVLIFSRVPPDEIRSLALDETSRTSVTLARVLLKRKLDVLPTFTNCTPQAKLNDIGTDALLLIGDPAMAYVKRQDIFVLDLGEEWKKLTGLPFVYAMWVARRDVDATVLQSRLLKARDEGIAKLDEIAAEASSELNLNKEVCIDYLKNIMNYHLGDREIEALRLFQQLASEDGLCPGDVEIVFEYQ